MSETRCKEFKQIEAKSFKESVLTYSLMTAGNRRRSIIDKLRSLY